MTKAVGKASPRKSSKVAASRPSKTTTSARSAVVTGGGSGIGAATVTMLAKAGYTVLSLDVAFPGGESPTPAITQTVVDITDADAVDAVAAAGPQCLDVVVNAAAIRPVGSILQVDLQDWRRCLDVNVTGAFLVSRAFLPKLRENGSIINVCSGAGYGRRELAAYAASKAALTVLTKCMALDHARNAIRVNAVIPGTTATPMVEAMIGLPAELIVERESPRTTTGLVLSADEVARGIVELAESEMLMTGAVIPIGLLPYEW